MNNNTFVFSFLSIIICGSVQPVISQSESQQQNEQSMINTRQYNPQFEQPNSFPQVPYNPNSSNIQNPTPINYQQQPTIPNQSATRYQDPNQYQNPEFRSPIPDNNRQPPPPPPPPQATPPQTQPQMSDNRQFQPQQTPDNRQFQPQQTPDNRQFQPQQTPDNRQFQPQQTPDNRQFQPQQTPDNRQFQPQQTPDNRQFQPQQTPDNRQFQPQQTPDNNQFQRPTQDVVGQMQPSMPDSRQYTPTNQMPQPGGYPQYQTGNYRPQSISPPDQQYPQQHSSIPYQTPSPYNNNNPAAAAVNPNALQNQHPEANTPLPYVVARIYSMLENPVTRPEAIQLLNNMQYAFDNIVPFRLLEGVLNRLPQVSYDTNSLQDIVKAANIPRIPDMNAFRNNPYAGNIVPQDGKRPTGVIESIFDDIKNNKVGAIIDFARDLTAAKSRALNKFFTNVPIIGPLTRTGTEMVENGLGTLQNTMMNPLMDAGNSMMRPLMNVGNTLMNPTMNNASTSPLMRPPAK